MIPEPIEGQDRQLDRIYPLPLAHTIVHDHFDRGPVETLQKVIYYHSRDYMNFPLPKHLPQKAGIPLDLAGRPPDHNNFSIHPTHSHTKPVVISHLHSSNYLLGTCINK